MPAQNNLAITGKTDKKPSKPLQKTGRSPDLPQVGFLQTTSLLPCLSEGYKCNTFPIFDKALAFFVDTREIDRYDSLARITYLIDRLSPPQLFDPKAGFPKVMASNPEGAYMPKAAEAGPTTGRVKTTDPTAESAPNGGDAGMVEQYTRLRDRYSRTTTALSSAAHDLKTPLSILNGYIELLRSEKLGNLNDRQREVLRDMHSSGRRLEHFIQDFLTFSVLETGEMKMRFTENDMNSCLSEVCQLWSNRFQEKGLALYFLGNEKLIPFPFDSAKIQRVISNLLENSSKYTPAGGTVWLHAEPYMWERRGADAQNISAERRQRALTVPNAVKISVADTGPGIPAEYHLEVFDDFFRLPDADSQADGMGLGLAIARRLVTAMGGKIWVESDQGAGSKFCFIIPQTPPTTSTGQEKPNA